MQKLKPPSCKTLECRRSRNKDRIRPVQYGEVLNIRAEHGLGL